MVDTVNDWAEKDKAAKILETSPEFKALKAENKKLKDVAAKIKTSESIIVDAVKDIYKDPGFTIPKLTYMSKSKSKEVAVLHVTDWQIGKNNPTYNTKIAAERMNLLADKVIHITDLRRHTANINECVIFAGGDMVEGDEIFRNQSYEIDSPVMEQACKSVPNIFVNLVIKLLGTFKKIRIYCVRGNHGRVSSANAYKYTNFDIVAYHIAKHMLEAACLRNNINFADRIEFEIAEDKFWIATDIEGWSNLLIHGDEIQGQGGFAQFPLGSVVRKTFGWIEALDVPFDFLWMGHRHQHLLFSINNKTILSTGSPESGNEFAKEVLAVTGYPSQRLSFFNKEYGMISDNQIFLSEPGDRKPAKTRRY